MRIWSIHPKYLDTKGLVAVWRESLLAKKVLEGNTRGYKNHPQLIRFKQMENPLHAINHYLAEIHKEAKCRNYRFDRDKIGNFQPVKMSVTNGQLAYERKHLLKKLEIRNLVRFEQLRQTEIIEPVSFFEVTDGEIEEWEIGVTDSFLSNGRY